MEGALELITAIDVSDDRAVAFATGGLRLVSLHKASLFGDAMPAELVATASEAKARSDIIRGAVEKARHYYGQSAFDRTIYIGDGRWDAEVARVMGLEFIGVGRSLSRFAGECPRANWVESLSAIDLATPFPFAV